MEMRKRLSLLGLVTTLTGCAEGLPVAPVPVCPNGAQVETTYTGPFIAGDRIFRTTGRRGELDMDYGGKITHLDVGDGVRYTVNDPLGLTLPVMRNYRIVNAATDFGTEISVIVSCDEDK